MHGRDLHSLHKTVHTIKCWFERQQHTCNNRLWFVFFNTEASRGILAYFWSTLSLNSWFCAATYWIKSTDEHNLQFMIITYSVLHTELYLQTDQTCTKWPLTPKTTIPHCEADLYIYSLWMACFLSTVWSPDCWEDTGMGWNVHFLQTLSFINLYTISSGIFTPDIKEPFLRLSLVTLQEYLKLCTVIT